MPSRLALLTTIVILSTGPMFSSEQPGIPPEQELPFRKINFKVLDLKTNETLALGEETIIVASGNISKNTEYYTLGKRRSIIQVEAAKSNLSDLTISEYKFRNLQTGESVELTMPTPPTARLTYTPKASEKPQKFEYKWTPKTIVGKTLHHFIVRHWQDLLAGRSPEFALFVPMKRDQFKFRVRVDREIKVRDQQTRVVSLEPANWAMRALVPRMDFFYAIRNGLPVLIRYEGATTVAINGDDQKEVAIEFEYES